MVQVRVRDELAQCQRKRLQRERTHDPDAWVQEKLFEAAQQDKKRKAIGALSKRAQRARNFEAALQT